MVPVEALLPVFDVPASETAYAQNADAIDVVMPTNGGKLQADGTWLQEPRKLESAWAQRLPRRARQAGSRYLPIVGNDRRGIFSVLAERALQRRAAEELVALAKRRALDRRWEGVMIDLEGIPGSHRPALSAFYRLLSDRLHAAGLTVGISVGGRPIDDGADDFSVVAEVADVVDLRCYGYRGPSPRSIAPCWWLAQCIEFAQSHGISGRRLVLGLGTFCRYWPDSAANYPVAEITYDAALQLLADAGAEPRWIERSESGLVRERFAQVGRGHVWIHDEDTHRFALHLATSYGVTNISVFCPGMGDRHWPATRAWRQGAASLPDADTPVLWRTAGTWVE
jgi:spore germination protein YaaH